MVGGGFEPPKSLTADLQSAPFGRSGTPPHHGADDGTRTRNLLITNQLLCQLSYASVREGLIHTFSALWQAKFDKNYFQAHGVDAETVRLAFEVPPVLVD